MNLIRSWTDSPKRIVANGWVGQDHARDPRSAAIPDLGLDGIAALTLTRAFALESQNASDNDSLPGVIAVIFSLKICCTKLDFQV